MSCLVADGGTRGIVHIRESFLQDIMKGGMFVKSLFVASFMGVVGVSCTESRDDRCQVIDISRNMETMLRLNTEDISEDVRYVPLETSDESLIGDRAYVRMLGGKLLVASLNQPVKMFDASTGKFIRSVGAIGNGPEEYVPQDGVPVFFVDEAAGCIWIKVGGNRMLRFDGEGLPVDAVTVADSTILLSGVSQIAVNGKLYFYQPTLFSKPAYKMSVYDVQTGKTDNWIPNDKEAVEMELQQTPVLFGGYGSVPVVPACHIFSLKENRPLLHGYAVAFGLICELYLSCIKTNFPVEKMRQTVNYIKENYGTFLFTCKDYNDLINIMKHDKKNTGDTINFTLLGEIGDIRINQTATKEELFEALDFFREG